MSECGHCGSRDLAGDLDCMGDGTVACIHCGWFGDVRQPSARESTAWENEYTGEDRRERYRKAKYWRRLEAREAKRVLDSGGVRGAAPQLEPGAAPYHQG